MHIELLLQISIATLTALGTLLLGMGERSMALPMIAIVVSASSVYLTDVSGWLRLNPRVANIAGSTAVVVFVWDFLQRFGTETQLLAVANLLIYLQFVLLYQRKTNSTYWLLALLSLLQVAVATALNFEMLFGALLLVYLVCGLTALGLFYLHREVQRCQQQEMRVDATAVGTTDGRRWPLPMTGSPIRTGWQTTETADVLGWRFVRQMSGLSAMTVAFALAFFFMVPRVSQTTWQTRPGTAQRMTGAANEVTLGQLGTIIESPEKVFTIRFYEGGDRDRPYLLTEAPLFRGPCLTQYSQGKWQQSQESIHRVSAPVLYGAVDDLVMQEVRLEPLAVDTIYCVAPIEGVASDHSDRFVYNHELEQIWRARSLNETTTVRIFTSGLANGRQLQFMPALRNADSNEMLEYPQEDLPRLAEFAEVIVGDIPASDSIGRARALLNYLHNSGQYRYSLVAPQRNADLDPIEDFLFEHREGHCEYYASALTLLLRSIGIPARVVLGFNGGEWNSLGQFYLVRQLNAHAWVEAFIERESMPEGYEDRRWRHGAWMTLDPTPGSSASPSRIGTVAGWPSMRQFIDYTRFLWSSYIMGMDSERQLRVIYEPVLKWLISTWNVISDLDWWRAVFTKIALRVGIDDPQIARIVLGMSLVLLALAVVLRAWRLPMLLVSKLWVLLTGREWIGSRRSSPVIAFYLQLEALLAPYGITRPDSMTQYEFARMAAAKLAEAGQPGYIIAAPLRVADAFYQVRFGQRHLDNQQAKAVEQALSVLEQSSRTAPPRPV